MANECVGFLLMKTPSISEKVEMTQSLSSGSRPFAVYQDPPEPITEKVTKDADKPLVNSDGHQTNSDLKTSDSTSGSDKVLKVTPDAVDTPVATLTTALKLAEGCKETQSTDQKDVSDHQDIPQSCSPLSHPQESPRQDSTTVVLKPAKSQTNRSFWDKENYDHQNHIFVNDIKTPSRSKKRTKHNSQDKAILKQKIFLPSPLADITEAFSPQTMAFGMRNDSESDSDWHHQPGPSSPRKRASPEPEDIIRFMGLKITVRNVEEQDSEKDVSAVELKSKPLEAKPVLSSNVQSFKSKDPKSKTHVSTKACPLEEKPKVSTRPPLATKTQVNSSKLPLSTSRPTIRKMR